MKGRSVVGGVVLVLHRIAPKRVAISALVVTAFVLLQGFPPIGGPAAAAALSLPSQPVTIAVAVLAVR